MSNKEITLQEFYETHQKLKANEIVVDVRRPEEYQDAHIKGALNIPVDVVARSAGELMAYESVYIHCKRGGRAKTAYEALKAQGLTNLVCVSDGGMDAWIERGYPIEK